MAISSGNGATHKSVQKWFWIHGNPLRGSAVLMQQAFSKVSIVNGPTKDLTENRYSSGSQKTLTKPHKANLYIKSEILWDFTTPLIFFSIVVREQSPLLVSLCHSF